MYRTVVTKGFRASDLRLFWSMLLVAIVVGTSGCGYHLRGVTSLEPAYQRVYVEGLSPSDPVYQALARQFANTHSELVTNPSDATATLVVDRNTVERRIAVVNTQAVVQQYELLQRLTWHVRLPDGRVTAKRTVRQARNYNYDPTVVLASSGNEAQIRAELAETIGRLVFYGLRAPLHASKPGDDSAQ